MKKAIKKLMAALLAVAMLCAMAVPAAFAAEETGSITINNAVSGKTYNVYRILDVDTHDAKYDSVVYKTNTKWASFIDSIKDTYFDAISNDGIVTVKSTLTASDAKNLAASAKAWLNSNNIAADAAPVVAASNTVEFTGLKLGYYLVVSTGWDSDVEVVCSLDTTDPNVEIEEKNGKPTLDKEIIENGKPTDRNTAGIGDYVQFQITVHVIDGHPTNYVIHDKMSKGLTFVNNPEHPVTVKVGSRNLTTAEYSFETPSDDCTFELKIKDGILSSNDEITVTYFGQINSDAEIITGSNTNDAKLTYGTNGDSSWQQTVTKVYGFKVFKHAGNDTSKLLPGAQFRLYKTVDETTYYAQFDANGLLTGWTTTEGEATILTSNDKDALVLNGLDAGTYYLEETQAPDGYNKLTAPVIVTISEDGSVDPATAGVVYVSNNAGTTLPSTGGMGTTLFYVIGGGLMVAAVILLITKKRMENK